ncbi:hypothetical protein KIW84_010566 [Lathyrus oleraceus]|uniref:Ubiquitin-like protease family profile domain-containing protein n=1 Tax=Pisum sativum TaxID=3888 RepID=A0A9D4YL83_PEA|nr:hypothetical protein KIW84_010566 [Pisum sativum]
MHSLKQTGDFLASLGSPVSIEDMTDYILCSLDDGYRSVIDGVNARDNPITFDDLLENLIIQELSIVVCRTFRQQHLGIPPPPRDSPQVNTAMVSLPQTDYLVDSGATYHITNDLANMTIHHPYMGPDSLLMGNGPDNGGDSIGLCPFLTNHGISHHTTPPHTPEHNGILERQNRHIVEPGLALLHHSGLPFTYWPHAMTTAAYLINLLPTPILGNKELNESKEKIWSEIKRCFNIEEERRGFCMKLAGKLLRGPAYPYRKGRVGYGRLEQSMLQKEESSETSLPAHVLWKEARVGKSGVPQEEVLHVYQKCEELSQSLSPDDTKGILSRALDVPEYSGRVRGKGFGVTPTSLSIKKGKAPSNRELHARLEAMQAELDALRREREASASTVYRDASDKNSINCTFQPNIPEGISHCQLYLSSPYYRMVGKGKVHNVSGVLLHTRELPAGCLKVSVDIAVEPNAALPYPSDDSDATTVHEAVGSFVAWPTNLICVGYEYVLRILNDNKDAEKLFFIPFNTGGHWLLLAINPIREIVYYLDSLGNDWTTYPDMKVLIDTVLQAFRAQRDIQTSRRGANSITWIKVACPQQRNQIDCGYFMLRFMRDTLALGRLMIPTDYFEEFKCAFYTKDQVDEIKEEWCQFMIELNVFS